MHTDPIADLLTRIRNAQAAHHQQVSAPYSKFKENLLSVIKKHGFIEDYKTDQDGTHKTLIITLKEDSDPITLKRISKPGQRIYIKKEELKPVKSGLGISILSTSKGLLTNSEAHRQNTGGELICEIC